jgi:dTMP kinase
LIVLEGGEGCGKSTQAARLAAALGAVLTREPGGTPTGEAIRALLLDPAAPPPVERAEALLLLAARAQHVASVIAPALGAGHDVVCDRFDGSTLAYQGWGRGLDLEALRSMSSWAAGGLRPDVVVLLRVPRAVAAERLAARGGTDRVEGEGAAVFARVDEGFDALAAADPGHWLVVDGTGPVDAVAAAVEDAVRDRLAQTGAIRRDGHRAVATKTDL